MEENHTEDLERLGCEEMDVVQQEEANCWTTLRSSQQRDNPLPFASLPLLLLVKPCSGGKSKTHIVSSFVVLRKLISTSILLLSRSALTAGCKAEVANHCSNNHLVVLFLMRESFLSECTLFFSHGKKDSLSRQPTPTTPQAFQEQIALGFELRSCRMPCSIHRCRLIGGHKIFAVLRVLSASITHYTPIQMRARGEWKLIDWRYSNARKALVLSCPETRRLMEEALRSERRTLRVRGCLLTDLDIPKLVGGEEEKSKSTNHKNDTANSILGCGCVQMSPHIRGPAPLLKCRWRHSDIDLCLHHCRSSSFCFRPRRVTGSLCAATILAMKAFPSQDHTSDFLPTKGGKKGAKKKVVGPFCKKYGHDVKDLAMFISRTQGSKIASEGHKGHVFKASLVALQNDKVAFGKSKLITEDIQGKNFLTNTQDMDLTHENMCSMVKKWQTITEAHVTVKTTNCFLLHLFSVGFPTKKQQSDLEDILYSAPTNSIGKDIEKACQSINPLYDVFIRKVKMLKKPKLELGKLLKLPGEGNSSGRAPGDETSDKVERADGYEPPVQDPA
ncbi:hypothetical protein HPG69_012016 [Diceros bicornis minor]|uniref:Uncharacterized protein n=1 Tax=Diceros bicornis minor TaxID=77932 RepID=A0A7J7EI07_DICBM|nr:hypothetical protein HPG69_012016 [Diceros bicornis minor]